LSHSPKLQLTRWLFRETTTSFSHSSLHQKKKPTWHCIRWGTRPLTHSNVLALIMWDINSIYGVGSSSNNHTCFGLEKQTWNKCKWNKNTWGRSTETCYRFQIFLFTPKSIKFKVLMIFKSRILYYNEVHSLM
jgi:hypothetical protein